jgi:hypothetical protein
MKRILILLALVAVVLVFVFIGTGNNIEGTWTCTYYAIFSPQTQEWNEQKDEFRELFEMEIFPKGRVIVSTSGNENEGTYTVNKDTLAVNVKDYMSYYLIDKNVITLVNHPRAKIEYTKITKGK